MNKSEGSRPTPGCLAATPRTNAALTAVNAARQVGEVEFIVGVNDLADLARQLERELAEERRKNEQKILKAMEFGAQSERRTFAPSESVQTITTANPERRSSLEHSEVKPDGRSEQAGKEGGGGECVARSAAVRAGSAECSPRLSGDGTGEDNREGVAQGGAAKPVAPPAVWYSEHSENELRRRHRDATDHDAPDHMRGESFEKWADAEGYFRGTPSAGGTILAERVPQQTRDEAFAAMQNLLRRGAPKLAREVFDDTINAAASPCAYCAVPGNCAGYLRSGSYCSTVAPSASGPFFRVAPSINGQTGEETKSLTAGAIAVPREQLAKWESWARVRGNEVSPEAERPSFLSDGLADEMKDALEGANLRAPDSGATRK